MLTIKEILIKRFKIISKDNQYDITSEVNKVAILVWNTQSPQ